MRRLFTGILLQAIALSVPIAASAQSTPASVSTVPPSRADAESGWRKQLETWRTQRERELAAPDGWLTLIALDWLKPGVNSLGSAPDNQVRIAGAPAHVGLLTVSGATVQLLAPHGGFPQSLMLDGQPAREGTLSADDTRPSTLTWHTLTMVVLPRGGRYALRIKDADASTRTAFHGLHWYAPDLHYTVEARWIPAHPPRTLKIPTIIGTTLNLPSPGIAEFTLDGKTVRLEPVLEDPHDTTLFFILRDRTSQTTSYQAARFLRTAFPDHGLDKPGTLVLDFNQLYNPPCAYTPFATCPLPPDQNRLPIAIEAGEQRYVP
ncbi:MAG TPA: DUF1684 domain-containing protein [Terracidiphilus sp.]|nr:DUF1684 domain-containing protein [Terracidiphilus sp.]